MDKIQKAILDAVDIIIKKRLKNFGFNYYVNGIVKKHNQDKDKNYINSYVVKIQDSLYENIPAKYGFEYKQGDKVQILIKNGKWENKCIDSYINNKNELISESSQYVKRKGDTMTGKLDMGNNIISGIAEPLNATDAVRKLDFDVLNQTVKSVDEKMKNIYNYITIEGSNRKWYYRKWKDGKIECWGHFLCNTKPFSKWGTGVYVSPIEGSVVDLPFTFERTPYFYVSIENGTAPNSWLMPNADAGRGSNTQTPAYYAVRGTTCNGGSYYLNYYVIGYEEQKEV